MNAKPSDEATQVAACGVYSSKVELQHVIETLNQAGFSNEDILLLLAPAHPLAGLVRDLKLVAPETSHAASSELINWLLRFGAVVIPQVGLFIRSRDFLHKLLVEPITSSCLGNAAALVNLRIPERDAQRFGGLISDTGGFVYVSCEQDTQSRWAREILSNTGAEEACCLQESPQVLQHACAK